MVTIEVMARDFMEALNRRDWGRFRDMLHPEYTYRGGDGEVLQGPDAGVAVAQTFLTAFPDGHIDVQHIHTSGINGIVEFVVRGTHQAEFMGIAATGKQVEVPVCDVLQIREGKIYSEREYMDMLYLIQQLGVAPVPTAAEA